MNSRPSTDLLFLPPLDTRKATAMSNIPSIPPHSLNEVSDEKTYDALLLDHRAQLALTSIAGLERAYRRVLADIADVDADLAGDFMDESATQRDFLPYLVGRLRNIRGEQRPLIDAHWATIHRTIRERLFDDDSEEASDVS